MALISCSDMKHHISVVKGLYNLCAEDITLVEESAYQVLQVRNLTTMVTIALSHDNYRRVKTIVTRPQPEHYKECVQLTEHVVARPIQLPEYDNRLWGGYSWTLTSDYLIKLREAVIQNNSSTTKDIVEAERNIRLLEQNNTFNNYKTEHARIKNAINYICDSYDINVKEIIVYGSTLDRLFADDRAPTYEPILITVRSNVHQKMRKKKVLPESKMHLGYQLERSVYLETMSENNFTNVTTSTADSVILHGQSHGWYVRFI